MSFRLGLLPLWGLLPPAGQGAMTDEGWKSSHTKGVSGVGWSSLLNSHKTSFNFAWSAQGGHRSNLHPFGVRRPRRRQEVQQLVRAGSPGGAGGSTSKRLSEQGAQICWLDGNPTKPGGDAPWPRSATLWLNLSVTWSRCGHRVGGWDSVQAVLNPEQPQIISSPPAMRPGIRPCSP